MTRYSCLGFVMFLAFVGAGVVLVALLEFAGARAQRCTAPGSVDLARVAAPVGQPDVSLAVTRGVGQMTVAHVTPARSLPVNLDEGTGTGRPLAVMQGTAPTALVRRASVQEPFEDPGQADSLPRVVNNATNWLRAMAGVVGVLMLTVAGFMGLFAREPADMDRARRAAGASALGFLVTMLAPQIVDILRSLAGVG
ncbi:hypothetical protein KIH74_28685 [Kineosporia sp. J2-2]|uniref:Uncharacterized protein n=1 Tax=Kineosporia corallincola TaxID=2835133 RepID=A0ABS5TPC0_9ACTN|nr:hypothetical protein [Kineosporia corallincola]MBT0772954.1 hypothetical protein [Kineosporia corallincola]